MGVFHSDATRLSRYNNNNSFAVTHLSMQFDSEEVQRVVDALEGPHPDLHERFQAAAATVKRLHVEAMWNSACPFNCFTAHADAPA